MRLPSLAGTFIVLFVFGCINVHSQEQMPDELTSKAIEPQLKIEPVKQDPVRLPSWVNLVPQSASETYGVGESHAIANKDDALERAWISALLRIGMTNFPELGALKSKSVETLRDADYKRDFVLQLEKLDWEGLREATEFGSPFVVKESEGSFSVYRLLKWSKKNLEVARKKLKVAAKPSKRLPDSPEVALKHEDDLINQVREMRQVSKKIADRDSFVSKILREARCGIKLDDLFRILGPPDREGQDNSSGVEKYYWGTYEITRYSGEPGIRYIHSKNGEGTLRRLCTDY